MSYATSTGTRRLRVAIVLDHPAQHFARGFTLLSREPDLDMEVIYWNLHDGGYFDRSFDRHVVWDVDLTSTYPHWAPVHESAFRRVLGCVQHLRARRHHVIVCFGWSTAVARVAILFAAFSRTPILYYGDTTWQHVSRPRLRRLRTIALRLLFANGRSGALSTGTFNRDFYLKHGMAAGRVHRCVYPIVSESFSIAARRRLESNEWTGHRQEVVSIGFAAKLIERKAPAHLIDAAAGLPDRPAWHVTMIGDGPLRRHLVDRVAEFGLVDKVTFAGFKNTSEMPAMLADIDIFVLPSIRDNRGVVTAEAMVAGAVPIVSSGTGVWGAGDLVEHGVTGLVFSAGDVEELRDALAGLIADPDRRRRLANAARQRALEHDSDDFSRLTAAAVWDAARPTPQPLRLATTALKVWVARAITRPIIGKVVGRLTGDSIPTGGVRIDTTSPRILDTTRALLAFRLYERAELRFVNRYLRSDLDVVELGSSIGVVGSVILGRLDAGRRLIAVEADGELASIAAQNFAANASAASWELHVAAIAYGPQPMVSFVKGANTLGGRLATGIDGGELVPRLTLADLLARHAVDRYALVVDIDGAEAGIIANDAGALSKCEQMIIELDDSESMSVSEMRRALLGQHGFSLIAERGPVLVLAR